MVCLFCRRAMKPGMSNSDRGVFTEAVRTFWGVRGTQGVHQGREGRRDAGRRTEVTGGRHMDGFVGTVSSLLQKSGVSPSTIFVRKGGIVLPGFFRATKQWDLLVISEGRLKAVVEFKAIVGSFGNNLNNRSEEALGNAVDLWTAYREGTFPNSPQPWLGFFFLVEDAPKSRMEIGVKEPHFKARPEFRGTNYAQRAEVLCRKLVLERHYSSACLLLANPGRVAEDPNYSEPAIDLSAKQFVDSLTRHVRP